MEKNYKELLSNIQAPMEAMRKEIPDVMNGFGLMFQGATKEGALSKKHKELMILALGVAAHCDGCIGYHMQTLIKLGVSRAEVLETLGVAVTMGGGPSLMYALGALKAFDELSV